MSRDIEETVPLGVPHPLRGTPAPAARLTCVNPASLAGRGDREILLEDRELTIGRSEMNAVVLDVDGVSRVHASLVPGEGKWGVRDLGSKNGVRVNKTPVEEAWLEPGDVVSVGRSHYKYSLQEHGPIETSALQINLRGTDATMLVDQAEAIRADAARRPRAASARHLGARGRPLVPRTRSPHLAAALWWSVGVAFGVVALLVLG